MIFETEPTIFETGVSTEELDELYEQMADYARAIHEAEKLENDMYDFLEKGNDMSEFDPSASEDDSEAEIEESDEVMEDPLAEDDFEEVLPHQR